MILLTKDDFEKFYFILKEAFPKNERRTKKEQFNLFEQKEYRVYADGKSVNAFMAVWDFEEFLFLEHFAVRKDLRGKRLGSELFASMIQTLQKPLVFEVEPPTNEISQKRIRFYKKMGAVLNSFEYIQPPLQQGQSEIPLKIMSYPDPITKNSFEKIKMTLYKNVYKV